MEVRLPPLAGSSHVARAFVADAVATLGQEVLGEDVALLVSELVANAVIHARTEMVVTVEPAAVGLRLTVADGSVAMPRFAGAHLNATSGRGLLIVERLSSRWGVDRVGEGGKVVWAEIESPSPPVDDVATEDLIALWTLDEPSPTTLLVTVEVDVHDLLVSRGETDDLIRELQLIMLNTASRVTQRDTAPELVSLAWRLDKATEDFDDGRRQIQAQALIAAREGQARTTLQLYLEPSARTAALRFLQVLEAADALTAAGVLLLPPSTEPTKEVRRRYVEAIAHQLGPPGRSAADA